MSSPLSPLRPLLEKFARDVEGAFESALEDARAGARRELAGQLNRALRRMRQAPTRDDLGRIAAQDAAAFASGAAWFVLTDSTARTESLDLTVPLSEAAALREAAATREPVIAIAAASELSAALAAKLPQTPESRALIYPVVTAPIVTAPMETASKVPALLVAWTEEPGSGCGSALELLSQSAAAAWQAMEPAPPPAAPLVSIAAASKPVSGWESLPAAERQIHLRAQRFARVQAAEMRLRHGAAVQTGRQRRNLYEALRQPVDAARDAYRREFFGACPSMVDYLHLELTRTLANNDAELLGKEYPGPMA